MNVFASSWKEYAAFEILLEARSRQGSLSGMHKSFLIVTIWIGLSGCAGLGVADLASMNEDSIDSIPFVGAISAKSAEEIAGGCMGVKADVLKKVPTDEKGAKAVSTLCGHINREPCAKEEACVERCKEACKKDALAKIM